MVNDWDTRYSVSVLVTVLVHRFASAGSRMNRQDAKSHAGAGKAVSRCACHRNPNCLRPGGSVWNAAASGIPRDAAFRPLRHAFSLRNGDKSQKGD